MNTLGAERGLLLKLVTLDRLLAHLFHALHSHSLRIGLSVGMVLGVYLVHLGDLLARNPQPLLAHHGLLRSLPLCRRHLPIPGTLFFALLHGGFPFLRIEGACRLLAASGRAVEQDQVVL